MTLPLSRRPTSFSRPLKPRHTVFGISEVDFWRSRLATMPPPLQLPMMLPRPVDLNTAIATLPFETPEWLAQKLYAFARAEVVSVFTVVLSAWAVLIHRYSGQPEFVVGCSEPTAKNSFPHRAGLAPTKFSAEDSFHAVVERMAQQRAESAAHAESTFEEVVAALGESFRSDRHPVFQTAVIQRPVLTERLSPASLPAKGPPCDLVCLWQDTGRVIRGRIEYPAAWMDQNHMRHLPTHFVNLLAAVAALPNAQIATLPFQSSTEYAGQAGI